MDSLDSAVTATIFGNGASIFTQDGAAVRTFTSRVSIGIFAERYLTGGGKTDAQSSAIMGDFVRLYRIDRAAGRGGECEDHAAR